MGPIVAALDAALTSFGRPALQTLGRHRQDYLDALANDQAHIAGSEALCRSDLIAQGFLERDSFVAQFAVAAEQLGYLTAAEPLAFRHALDCPYPDDPDQPDTAETLSLNNTDRFIASAVFLFYHLNYLPGLDVVRLQYGPIPLSGARSLAERRRHRSHVIVLHEVLILGALLFVHPDSRFILSPHDAPIAPLAVRNQLAEEKWPLSLVPGLVVLHGIAGIHPFGKCSHDFSHYALWKPWDPEHRQDAVRVFDTLRQANEDWDLTADEIRDVYDASLVGVYPLVGRQNFLKALMDEVYNFLPKRLRGDLARRLRGAFQGHPREAAIRSALTYVLSKGR